MSDIPTAYPQGTALTATTIDGWRKHYGDATAHLMLRAIIAATTALDNNGVFDDLDTEQAGLVLQHLASLFATVVKESPTPSHN